jgi:uncharacterized membrane protein YtjA (UPF0391 family)
MRLYWSVVFLIVASATAAIGFGDSGAPTAPMARLISIAFLVLALLTTAGKLYLRQVERRARDRSSRRAHRPQRHFNRS